MPSQYSENSVAQFVCVCGFETQHRTSRDGRSLKAVVRIHSLVCSAYKEKQTILKEPRIQRLSAKAEGGKKSSSKGCDQAQVHKELKEIRDEMAEIEKNRFKKFSGTA
jgi:hypothetical protein